MKTIILISFLFLISNFINAQQQNSIFFVSPLIGDTLDLHERDYYQLFPGIPGFKWAVFYVNQIGELNAKIKLFRNNKDSDTTINNYASKSSLIDHLNYIYTAKRNSPAGGISTDVLQLSKNKIDYEVSYPKFSFGAGLSFGYSISSDIVKSIEDKYMNAGFGVKRVNANVSKGTLFPMFNFKILFSKKLGMLLEAGGYSNDNGFGDNVLAVSALFSPSFSNLGWLKSYIGIGIGRFQVTLKNVAYYANTPEDSTGGYYQFTGLTSDGGLKTNIGVKFSAGVELLTNGQKSTISIIFYASYLTMPSSFNVTSSVVDRIPPGSEYQNSNGTVKLSHFNFCGSINFYF